MKLNIAVNVETGILQQVKVEGGVRMVRALYETKHYRRIGYIRKGRERSTWAAYSKVGKEIGVFTKRDYAIEQVVLNVFASY